MTAPEYFTIEQVVERLHMPSGQTLANWRNLRKGPPFVKIGRRVLYPIGALLDWERKQTVDTRG